MKKVPVFASIAGAYRFAFGSFLGNLGVVWVPVLLAMAGAWIFVPQMIAASAHDLAQASGAQADPVEALRGAVQIYRVMALFWIAAILIRAEMMLGLTERALGTAKGPGFVYLSLGRPFWRVAGSYFAVALILLTAYLVLAIAGALLGIVAGLLAGAGGGQAAVGLGISLGVGVVVLIVFVPMIYLAVRMTFFLTVAIVDEGKFDLTAPWRLAGGSFWRIVAVGLAVFVPVGLVTAAGLGLMEAGMLKTFFLHLPPPGTKDPAAVGRAMQELGNSMHQLMATRWYLMLPLAMASSALLYGLATGASVTAYQAVTVREPDGSAV